MTIARRNRPSLRQSSIRRPSRHALRHNREEGVIIALVAVFMLFVIGGMMALSIDVVTFYTARSEAQLAADSAALAGARVLANSGLTSAAAGPFGAETLARSVAKDVATANTVGDRLLKKSEVTITFDITTPTDPRITVSVKRTDLPTFFAHMLGRPTITVAASATAEAYNPSQTNIAAIGNNNPPVAPICVKPWLLPNRDPTRPRPERPRSLIEL